MLSNDGIIGVMMEREIDLLLSMSARLRPLAQSLDEEGEARRLDSKLTGSMNRVLEVLVERGAMAVPLVAAELRVERQHVQRSMNALLDLGYVHSKLNPKHRRSPLFLATAGGRRVILREQEAQRVLLERFARTVLRKDVAATEKVLSALEEFLELKPADGG